MNKTQSFITGVSKGLSDRQGKETVLDASPVSHGGQTVFICHPRKIAGVWPPRWLKSAISCLILAIAIILWLYLQSQHATPRIRPVGSEVLITFHQNMLRIDGRVRSVSARYELLMDNATRERDLMALFDAANDYGAELGKLEKQLRATAVPKLGNEAATRWAGSAYTVLKNHIAKLSLADQLVIEGVNFGEFRPDALSAVKNARRTSTADEWKERAAFRRSYGALGIPVSQLDFIHGGFN
jgi:hypothetical protein